MVLVGGILGLYALYLIFVCAILLIAIFKFSVLVGILMVVIGGVGVGLLFSPVWVTGMGGFGIIALANETQNKFYRFLIILFGIPIVGAIAYVVLILVTYLVNLIIE